MSTKSATGQASAITNINNVVIVADSGHLKLAYWPQLARLPEDALQDAARLCALLAVRPTSPVLVARLLDMPRSRVDELLQMISARAPQPAAEQAVTEQAAPMPEVIDLHEEAVPEEWASRSIPLVQKLWNRLRKAL